MQIRGQGRWEGEKREKEERREMEHDSICLSAWVQLQPVLTVSHDMRNTSSEKLPFACCDAYRL